MKSFRIIFSVFTSDLVNLIFIISFVFLLILVFNSNIQGLYDILFPDKLYFPFNIVRKLPTSIQVFFYFYRYLSEL